MNVRSIVKSDVRFYVIVGVFLIGIYLIAIGIGFSQGLLSLDRQLLPFVVGFFLFMAVYFASVLVLRLEPDRS